ncbi:RNA methyltransferase [Limnoraphis robusta]|uniref:tRNA (guanosine(18)-2'-O)-methyltransferase n=1 Tax=Limnoraphis robusta CCNP1315 TaxID=3110306 RepID=A0ABU5U2U3_9CYAN|nr:RNA methyltransferase [Limnoraphis robusta]MEA5499929.1 RNA methyltransferase [Limnoraphis robusta BA-68 BA1]MEA5521514.1 RNA methyltransferase [Limnoraphis robusta CCNP1315]MEA5543942.1 RNA methyltransferase [Limnoraphis robusta CCNP1324]
MLLPEKQDLIADLSQFVTAERQQKIESVLQQRTRHITVILEDIFQSNNVSACLRNCECFGVQDLHIIDKRNDFDLLREVSVGSEQWLTLYRYNQPKINNTQICLEKLKSQGYKIVATTPDPKAITIEQISVEDKLALMFGTELNGLSDDAFSQADYLVRIPMVGFSESFNISVSVALCLYEILSRLKNSKINWRLSEIERLEIQINWLRQSVRGSRLLEEKLSNQSSSHSI